MLDVNMGVPLTDEAELLAKAITMIQSLTDLPHLHRLARWSRRSRRACRRTRAARWSTPSPPRTSGWPTILPLVKKYNAAVIALPNDVDEIPMEPEKRLELVAKIVEVATTEYGIALEDIVIDPLAMPIGADTQHRARRRWRRDAPHPRRVRPEHDLRRVQRVLRHAGTPHAQRARSCRWP